MKSPTAAGTRMPLAMVCAPANGSAKRSPPSKARTIGAQPLDCTATIRGRFSSASQPSVASSSNAFHMPISPVPPPVG